MSARFTAIGRFVLAEFGPLIVFWLLTWAAGVKVAIAGTLVIIVVDTLWRRLRRVPLTRTYILFSGLTLVFGGIDLYVDQPYLLKYEAVLTNLVTALVFVLGAGGAKPLLQQIAEQRQGHAFPERPDIHRYFQLFTLVWAAYFVLKALFYLWIAATRPFTQAMAIRSVVGSVSFGLLLAISITQGRRLFDLCKRLRLLPVVP